MVLWCMCHFHSRPPHRPSNQYIIWVYLYVYWPCHANDDVCHMLKINGRAHVHRHSIGVRLFNSRRRYLLLFIHHCSVAKIYFAWHRSFRYIIHHEALLTANSYHLINHRRAFCNFLQIPNTRSEVCKPARPVHRRLIEASSIAFVCG